MAFYVVSLPVGHELLMLFPKTLPQPADGLGGD
jgi:hypothetical protein